MVRCAIYVRVSKEEQVLHGYSIDTQKDILTKYANANDLAIVGYYIDEGFTARKKLSHRKEYQRMMNDVKAGLIDLILFTKLDRWFRNISDYYKTQETLEAYKVNWKTILENYDTYTASGRLHINIMLSVAQDEADRTSERIKIVFDNKVKNGEVITGSVLLGYKIENKNIVIDKETEPIVRDIFSYFELNGSINDTMKYINAKYNTRYTYNVIARVIKMPQYCGRYRDNNNYCETYITPEKHAFLLSLIKNNQRSRKTKRRYIFSGLITCNSCKKKYTGNTMKNSAGNPYRHYFCYNAKTFKLCNNHLYINEKKLETFLLNNISSEIEKFIYKAEMETIDLPRVDNSKEINRKLERLKELYINEKITMEEYSTDYDRIKSELIVFDNSKTINIETLKEFINSDFKTLYQSLDDSQKYIFWRSIISEIIMDGRTVVDIIFI